MNTKEIETSKILDEHNDTSSLLNRNYLIKVGPAMKLLKAI